MPGNIQILNPCRSSICINYGVTCDTEVIDAGVSMVLQDYLWYRDTSIHANKLNRSSRLLMLNKTIKTTNQQIYCH